MTLKETRYRFREPDWAAPVQVFRNGHKRALRPIGIDVMFYPHGLIEIRLFGRLVAKGSRYGPFVTMTYANTTRDLPGAQSIGGLPARYHQTINQLIERENKCLL